MKKSALVTYFLILSSLVFSQTRHYFTAPRGFSSETNYDYRTREILKERDVLKAHQVKSRQRLVYHKGIPLATTDYFDKEGRVLKSEAFSHKNKLKTTNYSYDERGNISKIELINSKGETQITTYKQDEENRLVARSEINFKGKYSGARMKYDEKGHVTLRQIFEGKSKVPMKELRYTYYENGDPETTMYFLKGKLKESWKYDCKPEGELVGIKNKGESTLCISEEVDEFGNRVVWERKFDENGKLSKYKNVYRPDSSILMWEHYAENDRLTRRADYIYKSGQYNSVECTITNFNKEGMSYLASRMVSVGKRSTFVTYFNELGEVSHTAQYLRNENGLLSKSQELKGKYSHTYLYHYKGNLKTSEITISKFGTNVTEYIYAYYLG